MPKSGANTALFTAGRTEARENKFHWVGPVITRDQVLYKLKSNPLNVSELSDAKKAKKIGTLQGDWRGKFLQDNGLTNVTFSQAHSANLKKLASGRIDLWVTSNLEAPVIANAINIDTNSLEVAYILKTTPSYIMLSKNTSQEIVKQWQDTFAELRSSGKLQEIADKWSEILNANLTVTDGGITAK